MGQRVLELTQADLSTQPTKLRYPCPGFADLAETAQNDSDDENIRQTAIIQ